MKKFIVLALIVLMISSFASADLTTDLEFYYSFDNADNTGSDPDDLTGNGYDGSTSGATTGQAGILGQSFSYDGVDDYVDTGFSAMPGQSTICSWVKTTSTTQQGVIGTDGDTRYEFLWNRGGVGNRYRGYIKVSNVVEQRTDDTSGPASLNDGDWHHLCIALDETDATGFTIYFDGSAIADPTYSVSGTFTWAALTYSLTVGAINKGTSVVNDFTGNIDELGLWSKLLSPAEVALLYNSGSGCAYSAFATDCGGTPADTINITDSLPINNSQFNTEILHFNLTANASEAFTADFYVNGALNQTREYGSGTDVLVDFNLTFSNTTETTLTYYFYLNTSSNNESTTTKTVHIDNVFPQITWNTPNNLNTTIITDTLYSNIFLQDPNMFSYQYNITYPNGTLFHNSSNNTLTGLNNYTIDDTVSFVGEEGTFYAYAEVCDGHTDENITIDSIEIENVTLVVEDEGDTLNVSMVDSEDTESVSYIEEDDKVSFGFESDSTTSSEQFIVESNQYIHILDGLTEYEGHLVMGKKWMDFETDDLKSVNIIRISDNAVEVTVTKFTSTDKWDFESIGELNCRNQTRSFLVHVPITGNNSQVLSGDISQYLLNVTMNTSYYTTANATLYWNNTAYPSGATNTSTHFFFNTNVTIPPLMNDTNVTYYWNYYLGTTEFNTSEENTTVYSPRISNCTTNPTKWVEYQIKDETFETLLNGSITFQFYYSNGAYSNNFNGLLQGNTTFPICMYPSWGNFSTNTTIQYQTSEAGYSSREYQALGYPVYESNRTVDLFLLEGATDITFHIIDDGDNNLQGVTVEAYRYRISTDTDVLVETESTDAEGKVILNLASGTTFYSFKIYDTNGTLQISTARFKLFSTEYEYIIQTGRANPLASRLTLFANLEDSLTYDPVTQLINYTYNYTGGSPEQWCFTLTGNGTQWSYQCLNTSSGQFNYTITEGNITYLATVEAITEGEPTVVNQLPVNTNTQLKDLLGGTNTLFIALIIFLVVSLLGLVNANLAIVLSLISVIIMSLFNLIPLSWTWLVGTIVLGLAMLWVVNRR
tara:strand:+ start:6076 stop:9228 length:3153 start_codon:yes stop_codon:yes gene_type:complete